MNFKCLFCIYQVTVLKLRLSHVEESLGSEEEVKSDMEREMCKLTAELRASQSKFEELSKETQDQGNVLASTQLSNTTCMERLDISNDMIDDYKQQVTSFLHIFHYEEVMANGNYGYKLYSH